MARKRTRTVLERGTIAFYYRPRVEREQPAGIEDVQHVLFVLAPNARERARIIVIGRKRIPRSRQRIRFLAFVDRSGLAWDIDAALAEQTYDTATRGRRHLPAARPAGNGTYELVAHGNHTHLEYELTDVAAGDHVPAELGIERKASWIVTVANPDPAAWGLPAVTDVQLDLFAIHDDDDAPVATPFPPELQARFEGRRYINADADILDHGGAELMLIGAKR